MVEVTTSFSDEIFALMSYFAREKQISVAELIRQATVSRLEDEADIHDAKAVLENDDDEILSHEEFWRGLES